METEIILIAEDDDLVRFVLGEILSQSLSETFQVILTKDGEEACSYISDHYSRIAVVITDYNMPKVNGEGVIKAAIAKKINRVILHTSNGREALSSVFELVSTVETMRFRYLQKPSPPQEINEAMSDLLDY